MRTIEYLDQYITPIDEIIWKEFIPTLFGLDTQLDQSYRVFIILKPSEGGLGINCLRTESSVHYSCSEKMSTVLQFMQMLQADTDGRNISARRYLIRYQKM